MRISPSLKVTAYSSANVDDCSNSTSGEPFTSPPEVLSEKPASLRAWFTSWMLSNLAKVLMFTVK